MNKITVMNNNINLEIDDTINVQTLDRFELFDVKKIVITALKNTSLEIEYSSKKSKIDIEFIVNENVTFDVFELRHDEKLKAQIKYFLNDNSTLNIDKFYDIGEVKEFDVVELDGVNSKINYRFNTIANNTQKYELIIYHNNKNSISNIINHGVNLNGNIDFNVTGIVYNGITDCELNQKNRIITFNDKKCTINPKLLIDENDVIANHSALIGKFSNDELFYLMSRGISQSEATILLVKGFLLNNNDDERLNKIIEKYWR